MRLHHLLTSLCILSSPAIAKDWSLDVPVNSAGELSGKSVNLYPVRQYPPYYTVADGRETFTTPSKCAKTSANTKYCRTEIKQLGGRWALATTNERLVAQHIRIESLPYGTRTVIGQIHGKDDELVRLYADNTASTKGTIGVYFINDVAFGTGRETRFILKDAAGIPLTLREGDRFNYIITPSTRKINVSVSFNGVKYTASDKINPFWLKEKAFYYKYGNYYQTILPNMTSRVSFGKVQ
jgi:hypothetical protein